MEYRIKIKCIRLNSKAFLALEAKFRKALQELSMQEGAESMAVVSVKLVDSYEFDDAVRLAEYQDMIKGKYHEQK